MAGSLLVGGAFAIYAVTDNADPFGINVTPGNLDEDKTDYVTLSWGSSTSLSGVGNLELGENRKAGVVALESTVKYPNGVFTLTIEDKTSVAKETTDAKLFDLLEVRVYSGDENLNGKALPSAEPVGIINAATGTKVVNTDHTVKEIKLLNVEGKPSPGQLYSIFVTLPDSSEIAAAYDQFKSDKVYLEVDWSPKSGDEVTERVVYFDNSATHWDEVYAYAWKGAQVNGAWPGVKMVNLYDDLYQLSVPLALEKVVFNNGEKDADERKTVDITLPTTIDSTHLAAYKAVVPSGDYAPYEAQVLTEIPDKKPEGITLAVTYDGNVYNHGSTEVVTWQTPVAPSTDQAIFKINLTAGKKVSAVDGKLTINFYYWNEAEQKVESLGSEYTAKVSGERYFYYTADGDIYVSVDYYLVGKLNGVDKWTTTDYKLHVDGEGQYVLDEAIALKDKDGVKVMSSELAYYPGGEETEYKITADGNYDIYFKPINGNTDWYYGYFYIGLHVEA